MPISSSVRWDLISYSAVCRLRGHKDEVTGLSFVQRSVDGSAQQQLLVSVSKDSLMMVNNHNTMIE